MIVLSMSLLANNGYQGYQEMQAKVNAVVKSDDVVMGSQIYWLGLYDHPYYSWESLFYYPRYYPGTSLADTFAHYHPDVFIVDSAMDITFLDNVDPSSRAYYFSIPRKELYNYLDNHSVKVMDDYSSTYGWVRVYRMIGTK